LLPVWAQCLPVRVRTQTGIVPSYFIFFRPLWALCLPVCVRHTDKHRAPTS